MIKNKKGMTLIEIIISIVLISIVLIFLFSLLIKVNEMNNENEINSTYLINKALIVKNIEEDLSKVSSNQKLTISNISNISNISKSDELPLLADTSRPYEYIKITGIDSNDNAYLGIYYYKPKNSYVISYIHGNIKATRKLPDYEKNNIDKNNEIINKIKYSNSNNIVSTKICDISNLSDCKSDSASFHKIEIPIFGSDGKDYSIIISYYGTVTIE